MDSKIPKQEIAAVKESYSLVINSAEKLLITNQAHVDTANILLRRIVSVIQTTERKRLSFTKPLNLSLKEINNTFKELTLPLTNAKAILTGKVMVWRQAEMKRIREEEERIAKEEARRRKIQEAHEKQAHLVSEPITIKRPTPLKVSDSTKTQKTWKFKIVDSTKILRDYMMVNEPAIRQAIRNGVREIAGVEIYQDEIIVVK